MAIRSVRAGAPVLICPTGGDREVGDGGVLGLAGAVADMMRCTRGGRISIGSNVSVRVPIWLTLISSHLLRSMGAAAITIQRFPTLMIGRIQSFPVRAMGHPQPLHPQAVDRPVRLFLPSPERLSPKPLECGGAVNHPAVGGGIRVFDQGPR